MTKMECAVVMAYTGVCMLEGGDLDWFYRYLAQLFGRPIYTHEIPMLSDEIKKRSKKDFQRLCEEAKGEPEATKYEYHYNHTDCIWYRPEARNRCPVTCAQYRDGWNDAMNYIFRDGQGYRPYRRDKKYGE